MTEMEVWKERVSQEIADIKQRQRDNENSLSTVKSDIHKLQVTVQLQDKEHLPLFANSTTALGDKSRR